MNPLDAAVAAAWTAYLKEWSPENAKALESAISARAVAPLIEGIEKALVELNATTKNTHQFYACEYLRVALLASQSARNV